MPRLGGSVGIAWGGAICDVVLSTDELMAFDRSEAEVDGGREGPKSSSSDEVSSSSWWDGGGCALRGAGREVGGEGGRSSRGAGGSDGPIVRVRLELLSVSSSGVEGWLECSWSSLLSVDSSSRLRFWR